MDTRTDFAVLLSGSRSRENVGERNKYKSIVNIKYQTNLNIFHEIDLCFGGDFFLYSVGFS